jgi:hypothetical protein
MIRSRGYLAGIALVAVVGGAIQQLLHAHMDAERISLAVTVFPTAICLYLWVRSDAAERGILMPVRATLLVPLIAIVGVPYYLIRTRPRRAALWQVLLAIGFAGLLSLLSWGGQLLVYAGQRR